MFKKTGILIGVYLFVKQMNILSSQLKKKIRAWNKLERFAGTSSNENSDDDETQTVPDKKDCKEQSETGSQLILRPSTSTNSEPEAEKKKRGPKKKN
jgi:hypothetical protein